MKLKFYPLDFDYKIKDDQTYFYLYGVEENGEHVCVIQPYQPYFYAAVSKELEEKIKALFIEDAKVISCSLVEKELLGKRQQFWKIAVNYPKAVPIISQQLESWGLCCYEKDILFVHRYLRDSGITPMILAQASGKYHPESGLRVKTFLAEKVEMIGEKSHDFKILAFDIETYAVSKEIDSKRNPILMLGFYGVENGKIFQKVITWKIFEHQLDYVEVVTSEKELLERFKEVVLQYQPDIITGYYSDGFDFPYLKARAEQFKVKLDLGVDYSEVLASDRRDGESKIRGMVHIDVLKFVRNIFGKDLETDTLTLDAVAHELIGHRKHSVNLEELAPAWDKGSKKLADFCAYNLHDACLCYQLCQKLMPDMLEFTKIVGLPLYDVIRMRFSRLVESYIMKRAIDYNVLAPNKPGHDEVDQRTAETYEGGFVYEPKPGLYQDIVVFDFRSLYPTIITAHNISPESFLKEGCVSKQYVPGFEQYWFCVDHPSFLSSILEQLILKRAELKKQLKEKKKAGGDTKLLEASSYALKILANSFYGYLGFFGARWYSIESARSTTAFARDYIQKTIKKAEEKGFQVVYGDSLTPDRKIFVMNDKGLIQLVSIGTFVDEHLLDPKINQYRTLSYDGEKLVFSPMVRIIRHDYNSKEQGKILNLDTTHGSTKVTPQHSIYRYSKNPKLIDAKSLKQGDFLVSCNHVPLSEIYNEGHVFDLVGIDFGTMEKEIFCYEDTLRFPAQRGICPYCGESALLSNHIFTQHSDRKKEKNKVLSKVYRWMGTNVATSGRIPRYWTLTSELAWMLGFYCAEGSVSDIVTKKGSRKCLLSFGSQDLKIIERVKSYFDAVLQDDLKIITSFDQRINKNMYYYRVQRIPLIGLFESGFGCGKGSSGKKVPSFILSAEEKIRRSFVEGYLAGDGSQHKENRYQTHFIRCDTNSKDLACGLQFLFKSLSHGKTSYGKQIEHVGWKYRLDKPKVSSLRVQSAKKSSLEHGNYCAARIRSITSEDYEGYVYDLEVEKYHNFVDAEGLLLVHNTDSCFFLLGDKIIDQALEFMNEINFDLPGNMELEFQGYYPKGIFVALKTSDKGAKKKYALMTKEGTLKITGFETVRRNVSILGKEVQEEVLKLILSDQITEAVNYVKNIAKDLKKGLIPLKKLVIRTQISRELDNYTSVGPQVTIARRLQERGEQIVPGTVVEYIIAKGSGLVRERAKLVDEVAAGQYDADYYLNNQIIPVVSSIFSVLGYTEDQLFKETSQVGLGKFF